MRRTTPTIMLIAILALAACDRGAEPELTVTTSTSLASAAPTATTVAGVATTTTTADDASTTTLASMPVEDYDIQVATSGDEGQVLWVTIPAEDYTDRDLEDFVVGVVEDVGDIWEFHVLDDTAAVDAARVSEGDRTEEEQAMVDEHYLVSVTEGNVITFHGPFEAAGTFLIGS